MIGTSIGSVFGSPENAFNKARKGDKQKTPLTSASQQKQSETRGLNYYADFSGCGHWRMIWPEIIMNGYQHCTVHGSTSMILDPRYYAGLDTVRIQRQASPAQYKFIEFMNSMRKGPQQFNLIYEIDDVLLYEDIPIYNKFREAFANNEVRNTAINIMDSCDEITVTCDYMKDYYASKINNKNITVIPNFVPRFWMGDLYDADQRSREYTKSIKHRKRPRVMWSGSGAHFDTTGKHKIDDFSHIIKTIKKTLNKYQWVLFGSFPTELITEVSTGKIEFHKWVPIYDYPRKLKSLKADIFIAPLHDNPFNNSKSDLKYIEGCAMGTPVVCQDIATYKDTPYKFNTGEEMVDLIDSIVKSKDVYMKASRKFATQIESRWLESNIQTYVELYKYPYGHEMRKNINKFNCM